MFPVLLDALWQRIPTRPEPVRALRRGGESADGVARAPRGGAPAPRQPRAALRARAVSQMLLAQPELLGSLADPPPSPRRRRRPSSAPPRAPCWGPVSARPRKDLLRRLKQAEELRATWRMLLGVTDAERAGELTALAEASLAVAWLMAVREMAEPRHAAGRRRPLHRRGDRGGGQARRPRALDRLRPRPLRDLRRRRPPDGPVPIEAAVFYHGAVEILKRSSAASPPPAWSSPSTCVCGRAPRGAASRPVWRRWRSTTASGPIPGTPDPHAGAPGGGRSALGRRVRRLIAALSWRGRGAGRPQGDAHAAGADGEGAGQGDARALSVKFGRGGLVDVEFITQALQLVHGRRPSRAPARQHASGAARHRRRRPPFLRGRRRPRRALSLPSPRLRKPPALRRARPHPRAGRAVRLARRRSLEVPLAEEFLEDYRRRTAWVRALWSRVVPAWPGGPASAAHARRAAGMMAVASSPNREDVRGRQSADPRRPRPRARGRVLPQGRSVSASPRAPRQVRLARGPRHRLGHQERGHSRQAPGPRHPPGDGGRARPRPAGRGRVGGRLARRERAAPGPRARKSGIALAPPTTLLQSWLERRPEPKLLGVDTDGAGTPRAR